VAKLTVNGITYESVNDMPPEVRRVYDQTMAKLPELADRDGDGIPDIVQVEGRFPHGRTTVRRTIVVNGTSYADESAMPPDVRQIYDDAMRRVSEAGPSVTKNELKLSFQLTAPGFKFRMGSGTPSATQPTDRVGRPDPAVQPLAGTPPPSPIEPASLGGGLRTALVLGACAAAGLMVWLWMRAR
jgi:hypothetical protein